MKLKLHLKSKVQGRLGVAVGHSHKTTPKARANTRGTRGHEGHNTKAAKRPQKRRKCNKLAGMLRHLGRAQYQGWSSLWQLAHCGARFACVRKPAHHSSLRCHSSVYFSSNQVGIFITKKRKKKGGEESSAGCTTTRVPPPRISGFGIVTNMATCNFIEISCNFISLKIANSLLEQL